MIKSIKLKNFKSFRDAEVRLGPVSIILGANGAGKSNLFDAFRFLKAIGEGRSVRDAIEGHTLPGSTTGAVSGIRGGNSTVTHLSSKSKKFELSVEIKVGDDTLNYYVCVDAERYRVVHEELKSKKHPGNYVYSTRPDTGPLKQDPESPIVVARFHKVNRGINPRREFSPHEFILSQFVSRRAESRLNEEKAAIVRDEFASVSPLELRPEVLRQYSPLGRFELGEHGENFAAVVWHLEQDSRRRNVLRRNPETKEVERVDNFEAQAKWEGICSWLSELTPRPITSIEAIRSPTGEAIFAVREEPYSEPIAAPSLSDGTLRFAALALATIGAEKRKTLVIEEIENGINPTRLSLLIRMLEQAVEESGDVQVIASTHAPSVLDYASKATVKNSVVIGWDHERMSSHPVRIADLPKIEEITTNRTLGELQSEGWLQFAADV
ncbi:AAA family ATPase [Streptosporangium sp. NPDC002607]